MPLLLQGLADLRDPKAGRVYLPRRRAKTFLPRLCWDLQDPVVGFGASGLNLLLCSPKPNKSNKPLWLDKCHAQGLAVFGRRPSSVVASVALARKRPGEALRN
jgi:hypothetical protein